MARMADLTIEAIDLGKEYDHQTIFRQVNFKFQTTQAVAVTGHNGSGKSTLLRVLSGMASATHGRTVWTVNGRKLPSFNTYRFLSYCSPEFYFDNKFTVREIMDQYHSIKPFPENLTVDALIDLIGFQAHSRKRIDELSSGMNQRIRLVLTICNDAPVLFLDEPCSNLDLQGVEWYGEMISRYTAEKLVFVASNDVREYKFCTEELSLVDL